MPWCPNCQTEYREGFITCADCGSELVGESEYLKNQPSEKKENEQNEDIVVQADKEQLLANTNDIVELSYITSMLQDAGIPYRIIGEDVSDYLMIMQGSSFLGKNIYVSSSNYHQAMEILNSYRAQTTSDDELKSDDLSGHC